MRFKPIVMPAGIDGRFWRYVDKSAECWVWTGARCPNGYGRFNLNGGLGTALAHRVSFALAGGVFAGDGIVRHSCDNPPCVRPSHLASGTQADNCEDMRRRGRSVVPHAAGEAHYHARWTDAEVRAMRAAYAAGESQVSIARRLGAHRSTIGNIVRMRSRKDAA